MGKVNKCEIFEKGKEIYGGGDLYMCRKLSREGIHIGFLYSKTSPSEVEKKN